MNEIGSIPDMHTLYAGRMQREDCAAANVRAIFNLGL